jgi:hypothetical protein
MAEDPVIYRVVPDPTKPQDQLLVRFEWHTEKNEMASNTAGMALFDRVLLAFIAAPGSMRSEANAIVERLRPDGTTVRNEHTYNRFGPQIEAFKKGETGTTLTGTPLEELPGVDIAARAMFKAMNVPTVEALAAISDTAGTGIMGFLKFRTLARAWLEQRDGQAPLLKMAADLAERDQRIKELEANNADILARVAALEEKNKAEDKAVPKAKAA